MSPETWKEKLKIEKILVVFHFSTTLENSPHFLMLNSLGQGCNVRELVCIPSGSGRARRIRLGVQSAESPVRPRWLTASLEHPAALPVLVLGAGGFLRASTS